MQLYALDNDQIVLASQARKHKDYRCPECFNKVRIRGGPHRQIHFYHLAAYPSCHQHKKTATHLQIQLLLHSQLPESTIEKSYPEIKRIADVSWEKRGIVFEIQYSAMSLTEAQNRCSDYKKLGLTTVWILHDVRFNKRRLFESEVFLRNNTCYYTNINAKGQGIIYDQFEICHSNRRVFKGLPLKVQLNRPQQLHSFILSKDMPKAIYSRLTAWEVYFSGDLIDRTLKSSSENALKSMLSLEANFKPISIGLFSKFFNYLKNFYKIIFYTFLEKLAR